MLLWLAVVTIRLWHHVLGCPEHWPWPVLTLICHLLAPLAMPWHGRPQVQLWCTMASSWCDSVELIYGSSGWTVAAPYLLFKQFLFRHVRDDQYMQVVSALDDIASATTYTARHQGPGQRLSDDTLVVTLKFAVLYKSTR